MGKKVVFFSGGAAIAGVHCGHQTRGCRTYFGNNRSIRLPKFLKKVAFMFVLSLKSCTTSKTP